MYKVVYYRNGEKQTDYMSGSLAEIRKKIERKGGVVLSVNKLLSSAHVFSKPKAAEIYAFLKAMSNMLRAGVRVSDSLKSVLTTVNTPKIKTIVTRLIDAVSEGRSLSDAMGEFSYVFGGTPVSIIRAGENSGGIAEAFDLAASHVKTINEMQKSMYKKLAYPILILVFGVIALLVNNLFIIPKILNSDLFKLAMKENSNSIFISALEIISYVFPSIIALTVAVSVVCFIYYRQNPTKAERILIKIPYVKEFLFYRDFFVSFFSLSSAIKSGERLDVSLELASNIALTHTVKNEFQKAKECLKSGMNFVRGFSYLTDIEKAMLNVSMNISDIQNNIMLVAERFHEQYEKKLQGLAPKIYASAVVFALVTIVLVFMAIVVPYGQIIGGLHG